MNEERDKDRADIDWLEARERGDSQLPPIDPARAEAYGKMQLEISSLPLVSAPEDGWEDAIYDELDRREISQSGAEAKRKSQRSIALLNATAKEEEEKSNPVEERQSDNRVVPVTRISDAKKSRRWMGAVASIAAVGAVAAAAMLLVRGKPENGTRVASLADLEDPVAMVVPGEEVRRSAPPTKTSGVVGDKISMSATQGSGELRLYLNGSEVVARCDVKCATAVSDGLWKYELTFHDPKRGNYDAVFLRCTSQEPTGDLNKDLENCPGHGIQARTTVELK